MSWTACWLRFISKGGRVPEFVATAWVVCPQRSSSFYLPLKASVELPRHVALRPAHSHPGDCLLVSFPRRSEVILGKFAMDRCAVGEFVSWQRQTKRCFAEVSIAVDNSVVRAPEWVPEAQDTGPSTHVHSCRTRLPIYCCKESCQSTQLQVPGCQECALETVCRP